MRWIDVKHLPKEYAFLRYHITTSMMYVRYKNYDFFELEKHIDFLSSMTVLSEQLSHLNHFLHLQDLPPQLVAREILNNPDVADSIAVALAENENISSELASQSKNHDLIAEGVEFEIK